jgi:serine phosphatase RsbU (regulator of sigma subunit)/Tfp pilus assembly protein PilF
MKIPGPTRLVRTIAALVSFCFVAGSIPAQDPEKDSLMRIIRSGRQDTLSAQAMNQMAWLYFRQSDYDTALLYSARTRTLAEALRYEKGLAASYNIEGVVNCEQGNYLPAAEAFMRSLKINERRNDEKAIATSYGNLGIVHMYMKNYDQSRRYYEKSLESCLKRNDIRGQVGALLNIGLLNRQQEKYKEARASYNRALKIMDSSGYQGPRGHAYLNMGNIFEDMADAAEDKGDKRLVQENNQNAEMMYRLALESAEKNNDRYALCHLYGSMAAVHLRAGRTGEAEVSIKKALELEEDLGSMSIRSFLYDVYSRVLERKGDHRKALHYFRLFKSASDSIFAEEKRKELVEKDLKFNFEKREAELRAKAEAEQKMLSETARAEKERQQLITLAVGAGLLVTVIFAAIIFNRFRVTRKQRDLIETQKHMVDEKNREIGESIAYAKNVQKAILPSEEHFKKHFTSHFIYYRPKDVVAGDFYWLDSLQDGAGEWTLVAAADATGHGVPGALVSVVCSNALNRAVHEHGLRVPGEILDKTTDIVLETFRKSDTEINDGMDISIIAFSNKKNKVLWAGANNTLCYSQGGQLHEIAGDKQPVGRSERRMPFRTHDLLLEPGMTFYLFTDGFADQFGGPLGKKFKHKQLKELLGRISSDSMKKQKELLAQRFDEWKKGNEQVDDICVIGLRV